MLAFFTCTRNLKGEDSKPSSFADGKVEFAALVVSYARPFKANA